MDDELSIPECVYLSFIVMCIGSVMGFLLTETALNITSLSGAIILTAGYFIWHRK